MPADTLTFEVSGDVSLGAFAKAMQGFQALISALSKDMSEGGTVDWQIDGLSEGSAIATIRGQGSQSETIERIVRAYNTVGQSLANQTPIPYSDAVKRQANALTKLITGGVTALRFETPFGDAIVGRVAGVQRQGATIAYAYGAIKGMVETLSIRRGLRFVLYDALFDRPISCYLQEDQGDHIRDAWGRRVVVSGSIGREPFTRHPVVIRHIQDIEILADVAPGSYRRARGILQSPKDSPRSEHIIRGMRDDD